MVLLTSSQVQVAISSAIVFAFTVILFLVGYTVQQRTVDSLHVALRPRAPSPRHKASIEEIQPKPINPTSRFNRPFGRIKDRLQWQQHLVAADAPFDWSKLAYAQLVRDHSEVCNALIIFSDLHRLKSAAPRLLLFPQHWLQEKEGDTYEPHPTLDTTRRLLKKASRRYRVTLVPVQPDVEGKGKENPTAYSNALLASLNQYKKVMKIPTPGLILDSTPLDSILAFADVSSVAAYPQFDTWQPSTIMVKPSKASCEQLLKNSIKPESLLPDVEDQSLLTTSRSLRLSEPSTFNATSFMESTAYIQFADPEVPGPEYDIPYSTIVKMRPTGEDQSFLWEKMYSTFKDKRYGVCGLDLEIWPPIPKVEPAAEKHEEESKERTDL